MLGAFLGVVVLVGDGIVLGYLLRGFRGFEEGILKRLGG